MATKNMRLPKTRKGSTWMVKNIVGNYIEAVHIGGAAEASFKTAFFHQDLIDHGLMILVGEESNKAGEGGGGGGAHPRSKRKTKKVHWSTSSPRKFFFVPHPDMNVAQYDKFKKRQLLPKMTHEQREARIKEGREDEEKERGLKPGFLDPENTPCKDITARSLKKCREQYKSLSESASAAATAVAEGVNGNVAELYNDFQSTGRTEKVCLEIYRNCRAHIRAINKMVENQKKMQDS